MVEATGRGEAGKQRVTGIGGAFFRARDPDALSRWYSASLKRP